MPENVLGNFGPSDFRLPGTGAAGLSYLTVQTYLMWLVWLVLLDLIQIGRLK
jgi:hypothetical protein